MSAPFLLYLHFILSLFVLFLYLCFFFISALSLSLLFLCLCFFFISAFSFFLLFLYLCFFFISVFSLFLLFLFPAFSLSLLFLFPNCDGQKPGLLHRIFLWPEEAPCSLPRTPMYGKFVQYASAKPDKNDESEKNLR